MSQRPRIRVGAVDEPGDLRCRLAQVNGHCVTGDSDFHSDGNEFGVEAVVVHQRLTEVFSVRPISYEAPDLRLRSVENSVHDAGQSLRAIVVDKLANAPLCGKYGANLCVQVAEEVLGISDIRRHHLQQVVAGNIAIVDSQRRNPQTFMKYLACRRIVAAVRAAANVRVVRPVHRHERKFAVHKDRAYRRDVRQMRATEVWVVEQKHVPRRNAVPEVVEHRAPRDRERADMHGYALALGYQPALPVQNCS